MQKLDFTGTIIVGGLSGVALASLPAAAYLWSIAPQMGNEGQFGMVFIVPWAIGWSLGAIIGSVIAYTRKIKRPKNAWLLSLAVITGGFLSAPMAAAFSGLAALPLLVISNLLVSR